MKNVENVKKPFVSVLIPARNEEKNIKSCILSLLQQDYEDYEIIVLNDNSEDRTLEIVKRLSEHYPRVRVVDGLPLKEGWVGKNYACFQLAKKAKGNYMLFTDADTIHSGNSITSGINCLIYNKLDGLSAYPHMINRSLIEKLYVKNIILGILLFLPLMLFKRSKSIMTSPALGSYMLYRKNIYDAVGGHNPIYNYCLEDMHMAKQLKNKGYRFRIFDGSKIYKTRMYSDFSSIYKSLGRFSITFFKGRLWINMLFHSIILILLGLPFLSILILPFFIGNGFPYLTQSLIITVFQLLLLISLRISYAVRFNGDIIEILFHPLSVALIFFMSLSLMFRGKRFSTIYWKNRSYSINHGF